MGGEGGKGREAYAFLFDGWTIRSKHKFLSGGGEVRKTGNGKILVVEVWVVPQDFICLELR